jgi:EAL domain-containing protein (putative c-di-GMP-specific phosphodiesterase class I)
VGEAEFRAPDFAEHACALFERAGLASGAVVLELPGPVFGDPDQRALTTIGRLRSAGFGIAFDGFGARHLDLLALRELPVDAIKLHSHDVLDRLGAGVGRAVVDAVVGVAHSLGLEVQAKSIETSEQLAVFREGGCDVFQGRLIGEPSASPRALRRVGMVVH